jgi:hypothetical protein
MCPACMGNVALTAIGVVSTGGFAALAAKLLHWRNRTGKILFEKPKRKEN